MTTPVRDGRVPAPADAHLDAYLDAYLDASLDDAVAVGRAAAALAAGAVVAHGFGNFYAISARADTDTIRRVNRLKGRPADQVGSVAVPSHRVAEVFDWSQLPAHADRGRLSAALDALLALGPIGVRGPARADLDPLVTSPVDGRLTVQVIVPGHGCPSNGFLAAAQRADGDRPLFITSANRSRHVTGAGDAPAHWRADPLLAEFGRPSPLRMLRHRDEAAARARFPHHLPMSTSIVGVHVVPLIDGRPHLVLERHGSLDDDLIRPVLARFGFGLVHAPAAAHRLVPRRYDDPAVTTPSSAAPSGTPSPVHGSQPAAAS